MHTEQWKYQMPEQTRSLTLNVLNGKIDISKITITGFGSASLKKMTSIETGGKQSFRIKPA